MGDRQAYEDSRKGYPVTFDNLSEEYERYREDMVKELAAKDEEIARLRQALAEVAEGSGPYARDPLAHATNTIEYMVSIAQGALTPRPTEGGE